MTSISSAPGSRLLPGASCSGRPHHLCNSKFNATLVQPKVTRRGLPLGAFAGLDADVLTSLQDVIHHIPLAYERVVYPCSSVNCGDMLHRSTLDPVLRMEAENGINPWTIVLLAIASLYLTASPGVLQGFVDEYILRPFLNFTRPQLTAKGVEIGRKLATGGFGTVFLGKATTAVSGQVRKGQTLIIKRATEFGEAEVWMNERLSRAAPQACAKFLTAYADGPPKFGTPLVLVWKYEGRFTLDDLMTKPEFPLNCETALFGRELRIADPTARKLASIKLMMQQMLENLAAIHGTGIVHRDIKPQNMILAEKEGRLKLIDLGAAADLRVGINYVPNEYLLDPRFAPPQQYVMSPLTPKAPPEPVAAFLSPVLWRLNQPDRFDMYSLGIVFMQLMFPCLRKDDNLVSFNSKLEEVSYDLREWRRNLDARTLARDYQEGFNALDADDQAGWSLLCKLVTFKPGERYSAAQALRHRWFDDPNSVSLLKRVAIMADQTFDRIDAEGTMARTLMGNKDLISEAQIFEELELDSSERAPEVPRDMPRTIAWWQKRQIEKKVSSKASDAISGIGNVLGQVLAPKDVRSAGGFGTKRAFGPAVGQPRSNGANGNGAKMSVDEADTDDTVKVQVGAKANGKLLSIFEKFR